MPEKAMAEIIKTMSHDAPMWDSDFYEYRTYSRKMNMRVINKKDDFTHIIPGVLIFYHNP